MKDFNDRARPPPNHQKELVKLIGSLSHRHGAWQVFADFSEMGAIAISNAVDFPQRESREARYMEIVKRYASDELEKFPQMFAALTMALETAPSDVMGQCFHDLELHNRFAGQFFTPYHLARMMAKMILADGIEKNIASRGFITAQEPAVGGGAMIIALAHEMREMNINYQRHLHVTAVDIDAKCVHMAYLQFSLLHIPAIVIQGDFLKLEERSRWHTPAHIMGGWDWKLRRLFDENAEHSIQRSPESARPQVDAPPDPPSQLTLF